MKIYGGANFPFVTSVNIPMVKWIMYAALLSPIAIVVAGVGAIVWFLLRV